MGTVKLVNTSFLNSSLMDFHLNMKIVSSNPQGTFCIAINPAIFIIEQWGCSKAHKKGEKMFRYLINIAMKTFLFAIFFLELFLVQANGGLIPNSWLNSLVLIETQKEKNFEPLGTGCLIGSKGYRILVTNAHVLYSNTNKLPLL